MRATLREELERPLQMTQFDAELRERCERVDNKDTAIAGVVVALIEFRLCLDGTSNTDRMTRSSSPQI